MKAFSKTRDKWYASLLVLLLGAGVLFEYHAPVIEERSEESRSSRSEAEVLSEFDEETERHRRKSPGPAAAGSTAGLQNRFRSFLAANFLVAHTSHRVRGLHPSRAPPIH